MIRTDDIYTMRKMICSAAALLTAAAMLCGCENIDEAARTAEPHSAFSAAPQDMSAPVTSYSSPIPQENTDNGEEAAAPAETADVRSAAVKDADLAAFHERLEQICEENGVYGMGVAVFANGEVIHTDCVGSADVENGIPVTDNTRFRAASVSKLISTMLVMKLCEEGMLDFDGDLSEQTGLDYYNEQTGVVKLPHLLTHTAGLTDTYEYDKLSPSMKYTTNHLLKSAHNGGKAGEFYNYSNFGAGTVGSVIEMRTGLFFHKFADKVMFRPLKMDAGYVVDLLGDRESCAKIYDHDGEVFDVQSWVRTSTYYESFGLGNSYLTAQCELLITAHDLALLGTALAGDGSVNGIPIVSPGTLEKMHTVYIETEDFGMGLNTRRYDGNIVEGRTLWGHPGNALGAVTGLFYDPSDGTGAALLTNHSNYSLDSGNGLYRTVSDVVRAAYETFFD